MISAVNLTFRVMFAYIWGGYLLRFGWCSLTFGGTFFAAPSIWWSALRQPLRLPIVPR